VPNAHIDAIHRAADGLRVWATFACGHRYETVYPRDSSARRASRAQITRWELPQGAATRCPACQGFGPRHAPTVPPREAQP
jgi:hypothetical protein